MLVDVNRIMKHVVITWEYKSKTELVLKETLIYVLKKTLTEMKVATFLVQQKVRLLTHWESNNNDDYSLSKD